MNYKLTLAYDGTRYRGWQRLPGDKQSIQGRIEAVLSRMEGTSVQIHGSGRTDAGVHALGQVASVQLSGDRSPREILDYVNRHLPNDIGLLSVEPAEPRFHARLTPSRKTYRYRIWASDAPCIFERRYCYCPERIPDADAMSAAAGAFPGTHDFAAFHTGRTNKSTVRTISPATAFCTIWSASWPAPFWRSAGESARRTTSPGCSPARHAPRRASPRRPRGCV